MPEPSADIRAVVSEAAIPTPIIAAAPEKQPKSNEQQAWEYLVQQGFSQHQVAGIMGNLAQEHQFKTDDVPGGLGIAQWIGARRQKLMQRANYSALQTQLQFMVDELNSTEKRAGDALRVAETVEEATVVFQNLYERCGTCMQHQRIAYAYEILARYR